MNKVKSIVLLVLTVQAFASMSMSIEEKANLINELNLDVKLVQKASSFILKDPLKKNAATHEIKTEDFHYIVRSGSGQSHKYVQASFMQNKNQSSLIPDKHLIRSITKTNKLNIPFNQSKDEMLSLHWQQQNQQQVNKYYSTWLINPEKGQQFTEKTSAMTSIRPMVSANLLIKGNDFPVRLYHQFDALVGHEVYGMHISSQELVKASSDEHGIAVLNLSTAGDWVLMLKHPDHNSRQKSMNFAFLNFYVKRGVE